MSSLQYKEVVAKLNSLQSNAVTLQLLKSKRNEMSQHNLAETQFYLRELNVTNEDVNRLNPVHIAGTKGKGSTCAFLESILRSQNFKTGFYSSPHLVHVRERIRINGVPLTESQFIYYFNQVYDTVKTASEEHDVPMPAYFKFLTLLSFFVCKHEQVDVMIVEVGIGGETDCTNVIEKPVVCGITLLDLDHVNLLGNTMEEIAWHKAGIVKKNRPVIAVPQQKDAEAVIRRRVEEKTGTLVEFTPFAKLGLSEDTIRYVDSLGNHQEQNVALAISLANVVMKELDKPLMTQTALEEAILNTHWAGRSHILKKDNVTYYLDGAHTCKSIKCCSDWFGKTISSKINGHKPLIVLLFQCTGDREPMSLLKTLLTENEFDYAIFTSTRLYMVVEKVNDNTNLNTSDQAQNQKCEESKDAWKTVMSNDNVTTTNCIQDALKHVHQMAENNKSVAVLVTGSLHLPNPLKMANVDVEDGVQVRMEKNKMAEVTRMLIVMRRWLTGELAKEARIEHSDAMMSTFFESIATGNLRLLKQLEDRQRKSWKQKIQKLLGSTFSVSSSLFYYWTGIVTLCCVYNIMTVTLGVFEEFTVYYGTWIKYNIVTDLVNFVDILVLMRKENMQDGVLVNSFWKTAQMYFMSRTFLLDLAALLPTDLFLLFMPRFTFIRANRLFKVHRVSDFIMRTQVRTNFPHLFLLFRLIVICYMVFHWNGCLYYLFSLMFSFPNASIDDWVYTPDKIPDVRFPSCDARFNVGTCTIDESGMDYLNRESYIDVLVDFYHDRFHETDFGNFTKKYSLCFYWSALTLTTLGEQPWPNNTFEMLFEVTDTLLGLLLFSIIVGDIGNMVTNVNATRMSFQELRDGCKQFMDFRDVHHVVAKRIMDYLEYSWSVGQLTLDESQIVRSLPTRLHGQLAVHIHMETLKKVTLFQECESGMLYEMVMRLKLQVFSPGDFICRKHDVGKLIALAECRIENTTTKKGHILVIEMYIIKKGKLEVVDEAKNIVFVTLEEGKVFGELSILDVPGNKNGNRRSASIRSVGYSDLYVLTKEELLEVMRDYPGSRNSLVEKAKEILRKDKILDEELAQRQGSWANPVTLMIEERLELLTQEVKMFTMLLDEYTEKIYRNLNEWKRRVFKLEAAYNRQMYSHYYTDLEDDDVDVDDGLLKPGVI
ncbi:unnamed protein product [Bursaphelenchus okinawaensis]|uniref:Cyclic nucleotide-binding domain-containing protein n=1 Tax=Bursaphelenchus okinawaensis TaxID=465554 RepID=A0A811LMD5_9BILA|nr:unnamed protein product [Bursaphelenchus okinawaensis]CAG9126662.1 unnamed protein product [Bursaphelenchus okinawaensis]